MKQNVTAIPYLHNQMGIATPVAKGTVPETGIVNLTQCNELYDGRYDVDIDCMLAYVTNIKENAALSSWLQNKHSYGDKAVIGIMTAMNRDHDEFIDEYAGDRGMKDVQTFANGDYRVHTVINGRPNYYMVPTKEYVEYKWKTIQHFMTLGDVKVIALEEPEFFNVAGYSEGFKEAYAEEYGTPWQPPETSATVRYQTQRLKALMYVRALDTLSRRIKENYPGVQVLIATHCVDDYCAHGIATGFSFMGQLPCVDGFIGQTWSDGVVRELPCAGEELSFAEGTAMFQYRSYRPFIKENQPLYLLQDPSSDNPSVTDRWRQEYWRKTVVAACLQSHTVLSESTVWPQRAFLAANEDYKTTQLSVYKMFCEMDKLESTLYTGTTGIALGLSDTASWCVGEENVLTGKSLATIFGLSLPLMQQGIPMDTVCLDTLESTEPLKDVNLLVLSYDAMKPLSEKANLAIAQWVQEGGQLLYLGGDDAFTYMENTWWGEQNTTPLQHLLNQMGVQVDTKVGVNGTQTDAFTALLDEEYTKRTLAFTGDMTPIAKVGDHIVAFEAAVGKGGVTVVGLPSMTVAASKEATAWYMDLCKNALARKGVDFVTTHALCAVRGRYVAVCAPLTPVEMDQNKVLIDLFDHNLSLAGGKAVAANTTGFYYDVTDLAKDAVPRIAFTGGVEMAQRTETAAKSVFTVTAPSQSVPATLLLGNGKTPGKVTAVTQKGNPVQPDYTWCDQSKTLLIKVAVSHVDDPVTVTVDWA